MGAVVYELMTNRHPFEAKSLEQLVVAIMRTEPPPLPNVYSRELREAVMLCLTKDQKRRPTIEQVLRLPILHERIPVNLSDSMIEEEFSHTILHGQNLLADLHSPPTQRKADSERRRSTPNSKQNDTPGRRRSTGSRDGSRGNSRGDLQTPPRHLSKQPSGRSSSKKKTPSKLGPVRPPSRPGSGSSGSRRGSRPSSREFGSTRRIQSLPPGCSACQRCHEPLAGYIYRCSTCPNYFLCRRCCTTTSHGVNSTPPHTFEQLRLDN